MTAPVKVPVPIRPGQAAYIMGVGTQALHRYTDKGLLTRDGDGHYDSAQVRALAARLAAEREERQVRRRQQGLARSAQRRERHRAAGAT